MDKKQIQFFRDFLEQRKQVIQDNLQSNSKEIESLHNSAPSDNVDFSAIETGSQIDFAISSNLRQELKEVNLSLEKIQKGVYGICESCEEFIDPERLKVKPHARYCVFCRESVEKGEL